VRRMAERRRQTRSFSPNVSLASFPIMALVQLRIGDSWNPWRFAAS
jgi:hypothetical protein